MKLSKWHILVHPLTNTLGTWHHFASVYTEHKSPISLTHLDVVIHINEMTTGHPWRRQRWDLLFRFRIILGLMRLYSTQLYDPNILRRVTSGIRVIRSETRSLKFQHKESKNTIIKIIFIARQSWSLVAGITFIWPSNMSIVWFVDIPLFDTLNRGWTKLAAFYGHFRTVFLAAYLIYIYILYRDSNLTEICTWMSKWQYLDIGSCNCLAPNSQQAITRNNDDSLHWLANAPEGLKQATISPHATFNFITTPVAYLRSVCSILLLGRICHESSSHHGFRTARFQLFASAKWYRDKFMFIF